MRFDVRAQVAGAVEHTIPRACAMFGGARRHARQDGLVRGRGGGWPRPQSPCHGVCVWRGKRSPDLVMSPLKPGKNSMCLLSSR
eukprot:365479-Chlamydomonas_euryale.AAC.16